MESENILLNFNGVLSIRRLKGRDNMPKNAMKNIWKEKKKDEARLEKIRQKKIHGVNVPESAEPEQKKGKDDVK